MTFDNTAPTSQEGSGASNGLRCAPVGAARLLEMAA